MRRGDRERRLELLLGDGTRESAPKRFNGSIKITRGSIAPHGGTDQCELRRRSLAWPCRKPHDGRDRAGAGAANRRLLLMDGTRPRRGATLRMRNLAGHITVERSTPGQVEVTGLKECVAAIQPMYASKWSRKAETS